MTDPTPATRRLSPLPRLLRGYAPLGALVALLALMVTLLPTIDQADGARDRAGDGLARERALIPGAEGTAGTEGTAGVTGGQREILTQTTQTGECIGRDRQIPGDSYSPPCIEWAGDNGGATWRGVEGDRIVVSARILNERGFQETLAALAGAEIVDRPRDIQRTVAAFAEYFNRHFQFYGRKLHIEFYPGRGSSTEELLGGGQQEAEADAIHVGQDIGAFAELHGGTVPFSDALHRQGVVNFGAPYVPREYFQERHPYIWSLATDCSVVAESAAELVVNQLAARPAEFAGPGLSERRRRIGALSPENPWYQDCHTLGERLVEEGLGQVDPEGRGPRINYRLDIPSMSNQAANVIARFRNDGTTTIICGCDPIFPVFLSARAAEQNYHPEWIVLGTAGTDFDIVGQLYEQEQWSRAFGISYVGTPVPQRAGLGYAAYKTVRDDEPAFAAEIIYAQMYLLALGVHMAGPNLTPDTFAQGMVAYPGGTGMYGSWGFRSDSYTPMDDFRLIWWDPNRRSIYNNKIGAYVEAYGGQRFRRGELPQHAPQVFR